VREAGCAAPGMPPWVHAFLLDSCRTGPRAPRRWLVETAERERRLVLTSERAFAAARHTDACLLVAAPDKKAQLAEVLAALRIDVTEGRLLSRCVACNGEFSARRAPPPCAMRRVCCGACMFPCDQCFVWGSALAPQLLRWRGPGQALGPPAINPLCSGAVAGGRKQSAARHCCCTRPLLRGP